jgi:phytoene dehydrogenase-like protein
MARFGLQGLRSAEALVKSHFRDFRARALFAGIAGHSFLPLETIPTASFGLILGTSGHAVGWPQPEGGAQRIPDAMATLLEEAGGEIRTGWNVKSLDELPSARVVLLDLTPAQLLRLGGTRWPGGYRRRLARYRYGPGVFKIDWALDGPIPWTNADVARAGTVHVGGTLREIAESERNANEGRPSERPYVLLVQQTVFDPSRAPAGKHTAWAYCHVPSGSTRDMTDAIESQVERFAPGFRDVVLARATRDSREVETHNANYVGGDINGGVQDLRQQFARPVARWTPYRTPRRGIYLCSSSTPPGGGVHGMCGYWAAKAALRRELR